MQLKGLFTPLITPFNDNNHLNFSTLDALVEIQIESGVAGLIVGGTTGEYYTLDDEERETLIRRVVARVNGRMPVVAGINALNTAEGIRRAKQAEDLGCDGLMMSPPAYSLPQQHEIESHFQVVADATPLDLILYDFPDRAGVTIEEETVKALAAHPSIVGIKESSGDMSRLLSLMGQDLGDFRLICGCDDQAADHLWWGVETWISGSANIFPREQAELLRLAAAGDQAGLREGMRGMLPVIQSMESGAYNQKAKLGAGLRFELPVGDVRQPLLPLDDSEVENFHKLMESFNGE
ncbi:4-hydroxy-tetrahydrodipicolinate synthase [Natronospira proteinivora]|uniref:4-hydroxy-tetrahydrodipicolinate synthase n=1 Tax=Natronospira proteinivora TaxID=1807133 RepID=A0ABT1G799_9GAMM|nr:dihydrodipicolinate synthase family protein [Natronospira proteinivora]MCP1727172.1 4-hydroxy-tetrahydrodipicolinate synthase [Natronospira proteinivora]